MSLAGWVRLSAVPTSAGISGGASTLAVRRMPPSGVAHSGHGPPQHENVADDLVLGQLRDGHRQTRRFGLVAATAVGPGTIRNRVAAPSQAPAGDGQRRVRAAAWGRGDRRQLDSAARRQGCKEAVNCEGAAPPSCSWRSRNGARDPAALRMAVVPDFETITRRTSSCSTSRRGRRFMPTGSSSSRCRLVSSTSRGPSRCARNSASARSRPCHWPIPSHPESSAMARRDPSWG